MTLDDINHLKEHRLFIRTDMINGLIMAKVPFDEIQKLVDMFDRETDKVLAAEGKIREIANE